ncbi:hypothetical protein KCTC32516_01969 [Polaribacter huanghezhanensis]|uniref:hypothetical protein n=1 Tax=Polaribacter huanghezhanensis TaxID=1354726 RepID=UPI002649DE20|nr:hypothetical protein [Polaribacter huanghezhanensis]WKD86593.1 hypothetical protein KCTC32516_01969 [Polaribacter huanghezhanensis]
MKKWGIFSSIIMFVMIGATAFTTTSESQSEWTQWQSTKCLKGINYRVKMDKYDMSRRARKWEIQFKNRYNATIYFNYKAISTAQIKKIRSARESRNRITLEGDGAETKALSTYVKANKELFVNITKIRFGKEDVGKNYYKCDKVK